MPCITPAPYHPCDRSRTMLRELVPRRQQAACLLPVLAAAGWARSTLDVAASSVASYSAAAAAAPANKTALIKELREKSGAPISDVKVLLAVLVGRGRGAEGVWLGARPMAGGSSPAHASTILWVERPLLPARTFPACNVRPLTLLPCHGTHLQFTVLPGRLRLGRVCRL